VARITHTSPSSPAAGRWRTRPYAFSPFLPAGDRRLFPWIPALERNWRRIREEMEALGEEGFLRWPTRSGYTGTWKVFPLYARGVRLGQPERLCPLTVGLLRSVPGLQHAGFSRLLPGTHIEPHRGFSNVVLRYHLALDVPAGCGFRIGGRERHWREGESWVFDDTCLHEAWNVGSRPRTVLLLDFLRPLSQSPHPARLLLKRLLYQHRMRRSIIGQARRILAEAGGLEDIDPDRITPP